MQPRRGEILITWWSHPKHSARMRTLLGLSGLFKKKKKKVLLQLFLPDVCAHKMRCLTFAGSSSTFSSVDISFFAPAVEKTPPREWNSSVRSCGVWLQSGAGARLRDSSPDGPPLSQHEASGPRSLPDPSWIQSERAAALAVTWGWSRGYKREIKPTGRNVPLASKNNDYTSSIPLYELQTKQRPLIGFLHRMLISQRRLHFSHMLAFQMFSSWAPTFPTPTSELALGQYRRAFTAFLAGADSSLSHFRASRNRIDLSVWLDSTV